MLAIHPSSKYSNKDRPAPGSGSTQEVGDPVVGRGPCNTGSWLHFLKAGLSHQLLQGRSQSPKEALFTLPDALAFSRVWVGRFCQLRFQPLPTLSAMQPPEDLLQALPTHPDVDRGMAPAPAFMDSLIAFKIMTVGCGLARVVTSLCCNSGSVPAAFHHIFE